MRKIAVFLLMVRQFLFLEFPEEANLAVLDDKNFDSFITEYEKTVIFFYTPKCGPCDQFQPQVEKASLQMEEEGFVFGKFDGHTHKEISKSYDVSGYPSILLFTEHGRKKRKYEGGKTYDAVQMWLYQLINPGTVELGSAEEVERQMDANEHMFVFFGKDAKDRTFRRYREFSYTNADGKFFHTFDRLASKKLGLAEADQLVAFKRHGEEVVKFEGRQLKVNELTSFVETNIDPRMGPLTAAQKKRIFTKDRQAVLLFSDGASHQAQQTHQALLQYAKSHSYEDYVIFAAVTPTNPFWTEFHQLLGLNQKQSLLLSFNKNGTLRYEFTGGLEYTPKDLENFVFDSRDNKAKRYYKSQDISGVEAPGGLEVVNSKAYHERVVGGTRDYVVCYYDASDAEQQEVVRSLSRVARRVSPNQAIGFAVSDARENEFADFAEGESGLAAIRLYKGAGERREWKKFIMRGNKLQEERMVSFLQEHASEWAGLREEL